MKADLPAAFNRNEKRVVIVIDEDQPEKVPEFELHRNKKMKTTHHINGEDEMKNITNIQLLISEEDRLIDLCKEQYIPKLLKDVYEAGVNKSIAFGVEEDPPRFIHFETGSVEREIFLTRDVHAVVEKLLSDVTDVA